MMSDNQKVILMLAFTVACLVGLPIGLLWGFLFAVGANVFTRCCGWRRDKY